MAEQNNKRNYENKNIRNRVFKFVLFYNSYHARRDTRSYYVADIKSPEL